MYRVRSYLCGKWQDGQGVQAQLVNPATEEVIGEVAGGAPDAASALSYARDKGGAGLRALTFAKRGELLRQMARVIHKNRDELIELAILNCGNTRGDAKFDIDGATGALGHYAELGQTLGERRVLIDGDGIPLNRSARFYGQHVRVPRAGAAVFVNAFNFPAWGIAEKAASALLAGMPVIAKPATATALVAHRLVELLTAAGILPEGALQLLCGGVGDLLDHMTGQDVLSFTGSGETGARLRGHARLVAQNTHVNVEADSLNSAVLGPGVKSNSDTYDMFVSDVFRDMTQKTGQKCTAIRRAFVPRELCDQVQADLIERLRSVVVGNPASKSVTMGPLATAAQQRDVRAGLARLREESETLFGGDGTIAAQDVQAGKGFFVGPALLWNAKPEAARATHEHEVFGPVLTLMAYHGDPGEVSEWVRRGGGGLVSSVYSDDRAFLTSYIDGTASHHGRIYVGSAKVVGQTTGPGTALPELLHGGPGRAGGGEELGGLRGLSLYMQRTALEGDKALLDAIAKT
jgi:3,4-dehydroadipyl-CoA semialdehyde dehydrogenase